MINIIFCIISIMKEFIKKIAVNTFIFFLLLFLIEIIIYLLGIWEIKEIPKFHRGVKHFNYDLDYYPNKNFQMQRNPEGLEYKGKKPILIFGCSFAYGFHLKKEQIFSYKLSHLIKRTVYNQAFTGWGIQHMLYQTRMEKLYKKIKEPEYVIYIYIDDHLKRLYYNNFGTYNLLSDNFNLRYKEKNGKLERLQSNNFLVNQIKRLYISGRIQQYYVKYFVLRKSNKKSCTDFALKHFIEAKEEMQKHWKDTKFVIFSYFYFDEEEKIMASKLKENGFIVFDSSELTKENIFSKDYMFEDSHPNEKAWDLLTPLIVKKLEL